MQFSLVEVTDELDDPHPLLRRDLRKLRAKKPKPLTELARLDIQTTTPEALERALRVMDALLKTLDGMGIDVDVTAPTPRVYDGPKPSETRITHKGVHVAFGIDEQYTSKKIIEDHPYPGLAKAIGHPPTRTRYERVYDGKLTLQVRTSSGSRSRQRWADTDKRHVEDMVEAFILGLLKIAGELYQRDVEWKRKQQEAEEAKRRAEQRRMTQAQQAILMNDLNQRLEGFTQAKAIREFIEALQARHPQMDKDRHAWVEWASQTADALEAEALDRPTPRAALDVVMNRDAGSGEPEEATPGKTGAETTSPDDNGATP